MLCSGEYENLVGSEDRSQTDLKENRFSELGLLQRQFEGLISVFLLIKYNTFQVTKKKKFTI